jgi:hypothetical protein
MLLLLNKVLHHVGQQVVVKIPCYYLAFIKCLLRYISMACFMYNVCSRSHFRIFEEILEVESQLFADLLVDLTSSHYLAVIIVSAM